MLCQKCKQRQAVVHFTQVINGDKAEMYLCEHCANEMGGFSLGAPMGVNEFFKSLMGMSGGLEGVEGVEGIEGIEGINAAAMGENSKQQDSAEVTGTVPAGAAGIVCNNCGMSYEEFLKSGKMGCSVCYDIYGARLEPVLKRLHGSVSHLGKVPSRHKDDVNNEREVLKLKELLEKAVKDEEYEKAAEYRDRIKDLSTGEKEAH